MCLFTIVYLLFLENLFSYSFDINGFLSLNTGKLYFDGKSSSVNLNTNLVLSPVFFIDDERNLHFFYQGYYKGFEDLNKLAGGDVLVRERIGHTVSVKYIKIRDFNYVKPRVSYSVNYIKETKDEKWKKGLFDYKTLSLGLELEQERPDATYNESFDFFQVSYPNYSSLISKYSTVLDTQTYTELSKNAGEDVLNSRNFRVAFGYTTFPKNFILSSNLATTYKNFYEQSIVNKNGSFSSKKRTDILTEFSLLLNKEEKRMPRGLTFYVSYLKSNQNSYDASRTKYTSKYYDYISYSFSPFFKLIFKNNSYFSYSFKYERLNYINRYVQDLNGNYLNSNIHQNLYTNEFLFKYPISKKFLCYFAYSYEDVESNMKYEAGYRYNYTAANLIFGFELFF